MRPVFTSFRARLLAVLVTLLAGTQAVTYLLVTSAARSTATRQIREKADEAARVFDRLLAQRIAELGLPISLLARDYAFASTFGQLRDHGDAVSRDTLRSALENYRARIGADIFLRLATLDGEILADTLPRRDQPPTALDPTLLAWLDQSPGLEATAVQSLVTGLFLVVIRPLLLPDPEAWILAGFPLDHALALEFSRLSGFEIAFVSDGRVAASTDALKNLDPRAVPDGFESVRIDGHPYLGRTAWLPNTHGGEVKIVLLRSLDREMAAFHRLERVMMLLNLLALGASAVLCVLVARSVTRPVEELSVGAARIGHGDYAARVPVRTKDEIGRLGAAFNQMAAGLEERDRVRDLLGKTVSPQIAAELVSAGVEVGGELREVTILFSDLRGFTTFSETQAPRELLAQLNAYFTAITAAIEESGGIVDKFIGDAIMAIFGAPVDMPDHADRAIAAAKGILAAEENLNLARAALGLPPLRTGIGIASGTVVAGNIGSPTRYNYTVVGNAVNLASRLESLTKETRFAARIICSDGTRDVLRTPHSLRDLGETDIRGKTSASRIWAVD